MNDKLMELKNLREQESLLKEQKNKLIEGLEITNTINEMSDKRIKLENEIREEAIEKYKQTGEKKFGQIGIRVTTKYSYDDEIALSWAVEHNLCLSLDKTKFKKQLKVQPLDFVKTEEVPTATIPTEIKEVVE